MNFYNYGCAWIWFWQRDVTEEPHKDRRKNKYERKKV